ncbi:DUF3800 domain-containing protein [Paraburkholderia sp. BR14263]|uniref:DUF3800 domain-containing protein n=1 Tax=unclassified Paraburkholderia TaxID=2615204 RepID=UPI0034CDE754
MVAGEIQDVALAAQANAEVAAELNAEEKKLARLEKEKAKLLTSLAAGDFSEQRTRVAMILNLYKQARNSDVVLALKYWETFNSDVYREEGILPADLFKLERIPIIVRARAKIQNEYGLFQADEGVRQKRRGKEEEMFAAVIEDVAPTPTIQVFADETGKTGTFVIVGAVWVLNGRAVWTITEAIDKWRKNSVWAQREVHFAKFGRNDLEPLKEYLAVVKAHREYLSFKLIAFERAKTRRSIEEVVAKLHEHMLLRGIRHEAESRRVTLPRDVRMTLDEEQSLDKIALDEMKGHLEATLRRDFVDQVSISEIVTISSKKSALVQLADLVAGAANRKLNPQQERGYKDEMADLVMEELGLVMADDNVPGLDAAAMFVF